MILCYPQMETVIEITGEKIPTLVIEEPTFLRHFMLELYAQTAGEEGSLVLSDNGKDLDLSAWIEVVDNCLNFQLNSKSLLAKIQAALERTAVNDSFFLKTAEVLQSVEQYIAELAFSYDCDLVYQRCTPAGLIKAIGVQIRDEYDEPLERLIDHMELVRGFDRDKLFILLHFRSYFSEEQTALFMRTVLDHGYHVLLVDSQDHERLPEENRITIDKDLCEF